MEVGVTLVIIIMKCVNSNSTKNKILLKQAEFMNLFNELGLNWYLVNETTRRRVVNGVLQESLLDQVLYTNEALVYDVKLLSRFGKSDHVSMKIELGVSLSKPKSNVKKEATKKLSWSRISSDEIMKYSLNNIDWNYSSDILNTEEMWSELHSKLSDIVDIVPVLRVDSNNRPLNAPWSNSALKRMRKHKDSAWNEFQEIPTNERFSYAMSRDKIYSDKEFILKLNYEKKLTNNLKNNSKGFYSYLRNKRQLKTGVPTLEKPDGSRTASASESAEVLADAFSSVYVHEPEGLPDVGMPIPPDHILTDIVINHDNVKYELERLNCFKSFGPDGIHPKLLKSLANDFKFVEAVVILFRACTDTVTIPKVWKSANVSALFKNGSKTEPLNYRPVSLTCVICKVYEQIVRSSMIDFLEGKLSIHQHGFMKNKSCLSNLLETFDSIINLLEEGASVDIFYFDFKKAFDRVPHNRLIYKLKCLGIDGNLLDVIKDFLTGRTLRVSVEGKLSSIKDVLSGIPQGSVLGPLLFIIFINDLPDYVKSRVTIFADDLKLVGNASDRTIIDKDLENLELWEKRWLLKFNIDKCKVLHLKFNDNLNLEYKLNGIIMTESEQEKDLGVFTSGTLLWNDQISACINKANKMICWITRNLISREKVLMLRIYKALVRPHLQYCVQLWNPAPEHGNWSTILKIEGVQRRFTRMIDEVGLLPYSERLGVLKLTTLIERRTRGDLIEVFKSKKDLSNINGVLRFGRSGLNIISKSNGSGSAKLKTLKRNFINERVKSFWNQLPSAVKNSLSLNCFKSGLEDFKNKCVSLGLSGNGNFWELSGEVLKRIEGNDYIENKEKHNEYLKLHPFVAKKKFININ